MPNTSSKILKTCIIPFLTALQTDYENNSISAVIAFRDNVIKTLSAEEQANLINAAHYLDIPKLGNITMDELLNLDKYGELPLQALTCITSSVQKQHAVQILQRVALRTVQCSTKSKQSISFDESVVKAVTLDGSIDTWNLDTSKHSLTEACKQDQLSSSISLRPDGETIAMGADDGTITLCSTYNGDSSPLDSQDENTKMLPCFSPDGKLLAVVSNFDQIIFYDAAQKYARTQKSIKSGSVTALCINHDNSLLAYATEHGNVNIANIANGTSITTILADKKNL